MKPSPEELDDLYNKQGLTTYEIADLLGCGQQTVSKWLIKAGLNYQSKKPTRDDLFAMYATEQLTTRQIATRLGVAPTSVKNWLKGYGIERRPASIGMLYHGIEPPSREVLYHMVHEEHRSYQDIADMYSISRAAISHWMRKYDIPKSDVWETRFKGKLPPKPSREEVSALYESGLSLTAIGEIFGYSWSTIGNLCKEYGIEIRPDGWDGKRYLCQDGHMVRSVYEQRVDDWLFAHDVMHTYEPRLPFNRHYKADFLANGWYIEVWGVTNNEAYEQRRQKKRQIYQQHNCHLIELPYYFFGERERHSLERRLTKCLQSLF